MSAPAPRIAPATLKAWLHNGAELALLDVREHGLYGEAHLFYSVNVPYSRLELDVQRLVPRRTTRIVLVASDDAAADRAASALAQLGYSDLHRLDGGVPAWRAQAYGVFAGVNVPSKTFGELAEHAYHTPSMTAPELARRLATKEALVVLDGRPYEEYQKMSIPTALCCPNGELALRAAELVADDSTPIVVNCAGRTRSIIGAQTLINLGLPNPVYALENGTQGWMLADYALEHGQTRRHGLSVAPENLALAQERAARLAEKFSLAPISLASYHDFCRDPKRTTYLFDVRTREEYQAGTHPGAQHAPGGQLIQATDQYVGTRAARLVLFDSEDVRAPVVATWLKQLGWEVHVLRAAELAPLSAPPAAPIAIDCPWPQLDAQGLRELCATQEKNTLLLIDLRPSMAYRRSHLTGAHWHIRGSASNWTLSEYRHVVLIAEDARIAALYARDLRLPAGVSLAICTAAPSDWQAAGLPLASSPDTPADADCVDFLFFTHDRHSGNKAAARQYLDWETRLLQQIDTQERAGFAVGAG